MAGADESLESWLNKATNTSNRHEDWDYIMGFCDQINKDPEGPEKSVVLLAQKIQSRQEWQALQALTVLGACMKNCGKMFHSEIGKYKFLNKLVRAISPKYPGDQVSKKVKTKVIEMLHGWTVSLPGEGKIREAYQMLKSQGVILSDPEKCDTTLQPFQSSHTENPVFDKERRSKSLADLLQRKKPWDLQDANPHVKNLFIEDQVKFQKRTRQKKTLDAVNNNVKLLNEMLVHFSLEESSPADREIILELYEDCQKLRQELSQLAAEAEDDDDSLDDILQASDDLSLVMSSHEKMKRKGQTNGEAIETEITSANVSMNQSRSLIDLAGPDAQLSPEKQPQLSSLLHLDSMLVESPTAVPADIKSLSEKNTSPSAALSLLDQDLLSLGLYDPVNSKQDLHLLDSSLPSVSTLSTHAKHPQSFQQLPPPAAAPVFSEHVGATPVVYTESVTPTSLKLPQPLTSLSTTSSQSLLPRSCSLATTASTANGQSLQSASSMRNPQTVSAAVSNSLEDSVLVELDCPKNPAVFSATSSSLFIGDQQGHIDSPPVKSQMDDFLLQHSSTCSLSQASLNRAGEEGLDNVHVSLDAIKPSNVCPVTAYDRNGVRVLLHFARDCPPGRPDVLVIVATMLNTAPLSVRSIVLQAAVPKSMNVKLQQPSGTELSPFNPVLPPPSITQILMIANPLKERVRMRYKLTFILGEQLFTEVGEVKAFPSPDK